MSVKKNIFYNYIGVVVPILLNFASVPIFIKYLGSSSYGLIGISALIQTWVMLLNSALSPVVGRCAAQAAIGEVSWKDVGKLCRTIDWILIAIIVSTCLLCSIYTNDIIFHWFGRDIISAVPFIQYCFFFLVLTTLFRLASSIGRGVIQHLDAQVWLNIQMSIFNLIRFCGAMAIAYVYNDVFFVFLFWFLLAVMEYLFVQCKVYSLIPVKIRMTEFDISFLVSQRKIIFPLLVSGFIYAAITNYDKVLLSTKLNLSEYGYYSLIVLLSSSVILISSPITQTFQPRLISAFSESRMGIKNNEKIIYQFRLMTAIVVAFIAPVVSVMVINAKEVVYSWSGELLSSNNSLALSFYSLGNMFCVFSSLLYLIQLGKGDLRWHVAGYSLILLILIPLYHYLALNSSVSNIALAWLCVNVLYFFIWGAVIFKKTLGFILIRWFIFDTLFMVAVSIAFVYALSYLFISPASGRETIFIFLIGIGISNLLIMVAANPILREFVYVQK